MLLCIPVYVQNPIARPTGYTLPGFRVGKDLYVCDIHAVPSSVDVHGFCRVVSASI